MKRMMICSDPSYTDSHVGIHDYWKGCDQDPKCYDITALLEAEIEKARSEERQRISLKYNELRTDLPPADAFALAIGYYPDQEHKIGTVPLKPKKIEHVPWTAHGGSTINDLVEKANGMAEIFRKEE